MIQLTLTLKITTAQVVETSVTVNNNSPIQDYVHPDDQTQPTFEVHVCCSLSYTQLCCQKGFFCEICNNPKIIYPFEVATTTQVRMTAVISPNLSRFANVPFADVLCLFA